MVTKLKRTITVKGNDSKESLGLVHLYTGDGKGKTTAALGLAMRAVGTGYHVLIIQFLKSGYTGELEMAKKIGFEIEQFGSDAINQKKEAKKSVKSSEFSFRPDNVEREAAMLGFARAREAIFSNKYDIVILDEINCVIDKGLLPLEEVLDVMRNHGKVELVLTGRDAPKELEEAADYVNIIKGIKHPYQKGIVARKGIEY